MLRALRLFVAWALTLGVALGACWPARLAAQSAVPASFPPPPRILNLDATLPADGSILFDKRADPVALTAPGEPPIDGSWLPTLAVWTPSRMPQPGLSYTLTFGGFSFSSGSSASEEITFGPASTEAQPSFTSQLQAERGADEITDCCSTLSRFATGGDACFTTETQSHLRVTAKLETSATRSELTQFLFNLYPEDPAAAFLSGQHSKTWPMFQPMLTWTTAEDGACFIFEVFDLRSGETHPYPKLERCAERGAFGDIGKKTPVPVGDDRLSHAVCQVPPFGYEARWCDINRAECEGAKTEAGCENFAHMCNGEPEPSPPGFGGKKPELPAVAGTGSQPMAAGAGGSMPPVGAVSASRADRDSGCAVRAARAKAGVGWAQLAALAELALFLGRRRRFEQ
jgi:hypothetical protein